MTFIVTYIILLYDMEGNRTACNNQDVDALGLDYDVLHFNIHSFLSHSHCSSLPFFSSTDQ